MKVQIYLLNRTYIAEDRTTGLMAYADTEESAYKQLTEMVADYWEKRRVVVPITTNNSSAKQKA